jgi:hypothetical protein
MALRWPRLLFAIMFLPVVIASLLASTFARVYEARWHIAFSSVFGTLVRFAGLALYVSPVIVVPGLLVEGQRWSCKLVISPQRQFSQRLFSRLSLLALVRLLCEIQTSERYREFPNGVPS